MSIQWPTQWSQRISRQGRSAVPPPELQQHSHAGCYRGPAMCSSSCPLHGQFGSRARLQWSCWSCVLVLGFGTPVWSGVVPRVWDQSRLMTLLDAVPLMWGDCFQDRCVWNGTRGGPELGTSGTATIKRFKGEMKVFSQGNTVHSLSNHRWSCFQDLLYFW